MLGPVQPVLELGVVHPGLPNQERQRFARAEDDRQVVLGKLGEIRQDLHRVFVDKLVEFGLRYRENVRNVELVRGAKLDADWSNQREAAKPRA